jgi:hypothetical protein
VARAHTKLQTARFLWLNGIEWYTKITPNQANVSIAVSAQNSANRSQGIRLPAPICPSVCGWRDELIANSVPTKSISSDPPPNSILGVLERESVHTGGPNKALAILRPQ